MDSLRRGKKSEIRCQMSSALCCLSSVICFLAMLIFAFHACTHMVGAGDTWVAMACGRHFINHGVDTVEPFSANSHKAGPTEEDINTWPNWAQWITDKVGLETVKYWHPTGLLEIRHLHNYRDLCLLHRPIARRQSGTVSSFCLFCNVCGALFP